MTIMLLIVLLGMFMNMSLTPEPPISPPIAIEVGKVVGTWYGEENNPRVPRMGALIRNEEDWQAFLKEKFPDGAPELKDGPGPDFTNAVAVIKDSAVCTGELKLLSAGPARLHFVHVDEDPSVDCELVPAYSVWQVDLDELAMPDRQHVTLES